MSYFLDVDNNYEVSNSNGVNNQDNYNEINLFYNYMSSINSQILLIHQ